MFALTQVGLVQRERSLQGAVPIDYLINAPFTLSHGAEMRPSELADGRFRMRVQYRPTCGVSTSNTPASRALPTVSPTASAR